MLCSGNRRRPSPSSRLVDIIQLSDTAESGGRSRADFYPTRGSWREYRDDLLSTVAGTTRVIARIQFWMNFGTIGDQFRFKYAQPYFFKVDTPIGQVSDWAALNAYHTIGTPRDTLTEDGTASAVHGAYRSALWLIAGARYQFYIEYKPIGPNPRGVQFRAVIGSSVVYVNGSNTGTLIGYGTVNAPSWILHNAAIQNVGGGVYGLVIEATCPITGSGGPQLFMLDASNTYNGLNNGSGIEFGTWAYMQLDITGTLTVPGTWQPTDLGAGVLKAGSMRPMPVRFSCMVLVSATGLIRATAVS